MNLSGEDKYGVPFKFIYYIKDDYGYLDISYSSGGNIRALIARCVAF